MRFTRESARAARECCAARTRRGSCATRPQDEPLAHVGAGDVDEERSREGRREVRASQRTVRLHGGGDDCDGGRRGARRRPAHDESRHRGVANRVDGPNATRESGIETTPARTMSAARTRVAAVASGTKVRFRRSHWQAPRTAREWVPVLPPRRSARMRRLPLLLFAAVVACAAGPGRALTLLTEENPPFNYVENGKLTGLVTDLVTDAMKRANVPYTMEVLPWNRAYVRAQSEKDTCLFATARLDNREKLFLWVGPLANNLWAVYGRGDFAGNVLAAPRPQGVPDRGRRERREGRVLEGERRHEHPAGAGGPPEPAASLPPRPRTRTGSTSG